MELHVGRNTRNRHANNADKRPQPRKTGTHVRRYGSKQTVDTGWNIIVHIPVFHRPYGAYNGNMMQTGLVVKYRVFTIAGAIGIAGALALIFIRGLDQILVFAFLDLLVLVVPGHMLNYKSRKSVSRNA